MLLSFFYFSSLKICKVVCHPAEPLQAVVMGGGWDGAPIVFATAAMVHYCLALPHDTAKQQSHIALPHIALLLGTAGYPATFSATYFLEVMPYTQPSIQHPLPLQMWVVYPCQKGQHPLILGCYRRLNLLQTSTQCVLGVTKGM